VFAKKIGVGPEFISGFFVSPEQARKDHWPMEQQVGAVVMPAW
jgi:hypothetical protein